MDSGLMGGDNAAGGMFSGAEKGASMGSAAGPWGALVGGIVGGIAGAWSGNEAGKAKKEAQEEQLRRENNETAKVLAHGRLAEGSSGVLMGQSSMTTHLDKMAIEFRRNHEWAMRQYALGQSLNQQASTFNTMSSIGSSLFKFAESNKWWQNKPDAGDGPKMDTYEPPSQPAPGTGGEF